MADAVPNTDALMLPTARLRLRPCTLGDCDALWNLWTESEVRRFLWNDRVIPRETALEQVEQSLASFGARGFGQWLVLPRAGGELLGFCGLRTCHEPPEVELLYGLYASAHGRGLATEASRAVLAYGFDKLGLERVIALADEPNRASVRVMERLGMVFERRGPVDGQDTVQYGLERDAFRVRGEPDAR